MNASHKSFKWDGRIDAEDSLGCKRVHQVIKRFEPRNGASLIGLASDLGVHYNQGRIGAKEGPVSFRQAFANLAWHSDKELFDIGDFSIPTNTSNDPLADAQSAYANAAAKALSFKQFVIGIGGGHEIAWASYSACRQYLDSIGAEGKTVAIINFDSHFDLRRPTPNAKWLGSSGTPFYQASVDCQQRGLNFRYACIGINPSANTGALFDYATSQHVDYLIDSDCRSKNAKIFIENFMRDIDYLYVTICLDALPADVAPGVSAPAALGVSLEFIIRSLKRIRANCKANKVMWLMSDIAELNPKFDIDQRTARVAARIAYEIINLQQ